MGAEIVTAVWDFESDQKALLDLVTMLHAEHGTFKTVAMCCHGERLMAESETNQKKWLLKKKNKMENNEKTLKNKTRPPFLIDYKELQKKRIRKKP